MDNKPAATPLHPLVMAAAISLILLSAIGIASLIGILPKMKPTETAPVAAITAEKTDVSASAPAPVIAENTPEKSAAAVPAPVKPAVHHVQHHSSSYSEGRNVSTERQAPAAAICYDCGTVTDVNAVAVKGSASGLGAVGGAVAGGVVGHQVGGGKGRDALTVLGALGGALAGNAIEKSQRSTTRYDVSVRMEDGSNRTFSFNTAPAFSSGDRVRVNNGELVRN